MGDYGRVMDNALKFMLLLGLAIGVSAVIGGWALWHFVLSHVQIGWQR